MMSKKIEQAVIDFTEVAVKHLDQEINGSVDPNLSRTYYEAAENLVKVSEDYLESNITDELEELKNVLIPSESQIRSAQVLKKAVTAFAGAVGMAFAIGFFTQLGVNSANTVFKSLEKFQDPEGEHMEKLRQLEEKQEPTIVNSAKKE